MSCIAIELPPPPPASPDIPTRANSAGGSLTLWLKGARADSSGDTACAVAEVLITEGGFSAADSSSAVPAMDAVGASCDATRFRGGAITRWTSAGKGWLWPGACVGVCGMWPAHKAGSGRWRKKHAAPRPATATAHTAGGGILMHADFRTRLHGGLCAR